MKGDGGCVEKHIQARLIFRKDKLANSETERSKLTKLAIEVAEIVRCYSTLVDLIKTIPTLAIPFERTYKEKSLQPGS